MKFQFPIANFSITNFPILLFIGFLIVFSLILPQVTFAKDQLITPSETLEEAKEIGKRVLERAPKELPGILENIWKKEVLPIWQRMYDFWRFNIWSKILSWFKKEIEPRTKKEIEKRKSIIKEEFKKEKEELKKELPEVGKSLWEKFKELIK